MKMAIVIPCYNEAENIPILLDRFAEVMNGENIEIVLINNGSTDDSEQIIASLLPNYHFASSVFVPRNQGYGYGILQGLKSVEADYIGWCHADMQTDPEDIIVAYKMIKKTSDPIYVKGNRYGRPFFDNVFTVGMSIFESIYFGYRMNDINAQPNVFPIEFYRSWKQPPYDFSLDLYAVYMAKRQGLKLLRFPVRFPKRIYGESKWNTGILAKWKFIKRTFLYSIELKKQLRKQK